MHHHEILQFYPQLKDRLKDGEKAMGAGFNVPEWEVLHQAIERVLVHPFYCP